MKYDRPVWQIMHSCADALPDRFRYEDVRNWFATFYPDVNEATIRAHLVGLTEGGAAKHVQFAPRSPVFRRVARGEYTPIPPDERAEDPDAPVLSASRLKMSGNGDRTTRQAPGESGSHRRGPRKKVSDLDLAQALGVTVGREQVAPAESAAVESDADEPATTDAADTPARTGKKSKRSTSPKQSTSSTSGKKRKKSTAAESKAAKSVPVTADAPTESAPTPEGDEEPAIPDVILLGSIGERVNVPAPAKEVYREVSFQLSRLDAELSGSQWFVLSAEHGLLAPNEWMSPDSRTLAEMDPDYRTVWASWVVSRLQSLVGSLESMLVRVDAPNEYIGPLFADLTDAGAVIASGSVATFETPSTTAAEEVADGSDGDTPDADHTAEGSDRLAPVVQLEAGPSAALHIADIRRAVPVSDLDQIPTTPGVYGWHVDPMGARDLNRSLRLPIRAGLIFVGQVGGSRWHSLADPVLNLRDHVERIQLHGRARSSTFRMTLATVLRGHLRMKTLEDPQLTDWMLEHLSLSTWACDDLGELSELEQRIVTELDPPLNVDHLPASEYRTRLGQMRSALA